MGNSLVTTIAAEQSAQGRTTTAKEEINRAISLCLHVTALHDGFLSKSGKKHAHRDIKPQNVLVGSDGALRLCDYGSAMTVDSPPQDLMNAYIGGSTFWIPLDVNHIIEIQKPSTNAITYISNLKRHSVSPTFTVCQQDRLALLRTIKYPEGVTDRHIASILSDETYDQLPQVLKTFIDTAEVTSHLSEPRASETALFYAAVLIKCLELLNEGQEITQDDIEEIRASTTDNRSLWQYRGYFRDWEDNQNRASTPAMQPAAGGGVVVSSDTDNESVGDDDIESEVKSPAIKP